MRIDRRDHARWRSFVLDDLPPARRDAIADRPRTGQAVLAAGFGVSEDAIRRDLRALAAEGRRRRVHGGALPASPATQPMAARPEQRRDREPFPTRTAAGTIRPGELPLPDGDGTDLAPVGHLPGEADLKVVTNVVDIAAAASRRPGLRLLVVGGLADPAAGGCADAAETVARMRFDRACVGARAVSAAGGSRAFFTDAAFECAIVAVPRRTPALATTGRRAVDAPRHVVSPHRLDSLVLAADAGPARRAATGAAVRPRILLAGLP